MGAQAILAQSSRLLSHQIQILRLRKSMVVGHLLLSAALLKKNDSWEGRGLRDGEEAPRTRIAARQRVAHKAEEGYRQRFLPDQGWIDVTPTRTIRVTLHRESSPQATDTANDNVVILSARMHGDELIQDEPFSLRIRAGETAADLEKEIWRMHQIRDADVAIELLGTDGEPIAADQAVLDALEIPARVVVLSFLRRSSSEEGSQRSHTWRIFRSGHGGLCICACFVRQNL